MKDIQVGDTVEIRTNLKAGVRIESANITSLNRIPNGKGKGPGWEFTYVPSGLPDSVNCGWGFNLLYDTPGTWGTQSVRLIRKAPKNQVRWADTRPNPLYKNPGYDLINL